MPDRDLLNALEKRVREVERLATDCILEGDVMRLQQSVKLYQKKARVPKPKRNVRQQKGRELSWPMLSRRSTSFGWPQG